MKLMMQNTLYKYSHLQLLTQAMPLLVTCIYTISIFNYLNQCLNYINARDNNMQQKFSGLRSKFMFFSSTTHSRLPGWQIT